MKEKIYQIPEEQLYRLLVTQPRTKRFNKTVMYDISEEHLFELLGHCAKKNKCSNFGDEKCKCYSSAVKYEQSNIEAPTINDYV